MWWRFTLAAAILGFAVFVAHGLGHLRGVGDADTKMMRSLSRAVLIYHRELDSFMDQNAREQAVRLDEKFGKATEVQITEIQHTGVKGFVFAKVRRSGTVHKESIMFGQGTIWDISSESD